MRVPPAISVVLPAYNAARWIGESLESILSQSFDDFELIVVNDGSTDGTASVVERFGDPRIRLMSNDTNRGIIFSLNRGIEESRGRYIARMDADDIARPERLARQIAFMEAHPEVGLCGTWARKFVPCGPRWVQRGPTDSRSLKATLLFSTPFIHPTVMIRRSVLSVHNLRYDQAFPMVEDYRLWCEMALTTELAIIPEVLLEYRVSLASVTGAVFLDRARWKIRREILLRVWCDYIKETLGFLPSAEQLEAHAAFHDARVACVSPEVVIMARRWLSVIREANEKRLFFEPAAIEEVCARMERLLVLPPMMERIRRTMVRVLAK